MKELDTRLYVTSVEKCITVLEIIAEKKDGMTLVEVARNTRMGMSAAQRFTYSLQRLGYLNKEERTKVYTIAPRALRLSMSYIHGNDLLTLAEPHLAKLAEITRESVNLVILDNIHSVYIWHKSGAELVSVNIFAGTRLPAFCTAAGRAILSSLPDSEIELVLGSSPLERHTSRTITDTGALWRLIGEVRSSGISVSNQECFDGAFSIAVPLARMRSAVNLSFPLSRLKPEEAIPAFSCAIQETANLILKDLKTFGTSAGRGARTAGILEA